MEQKMQAEIDKLQENIALLIMKLFLFKQLNSWRNSSSAKACCI